MAARDGGPKNPTDSKEPAKLSAARQAFMQQLDQKNERNAGPKVKSSVARSGVTSTDATTPVKSIVAKANKPSSTKPNSPQIDLEPSAPPPMVVKKSPLGLNVKQSPPPPGLDVKQLKQIGKTLNKKAARIKKMEGKVQGEISITHPKFEPSFLDELAKRMKRNETIKLEDLQRQIYTLNGEIRKKEEHLEGLKRNLPRQGNASSEEYPNKTLRDLLLKRMGLELDIATSDKNKPGYFSKTKEARIAERQILNFIHPDILDGCLRQADLDCNEKTKLEIQQRMLLSIRNDLMVEERRSEKSEMEKQVAKMLEDIEKAKKRCSGDVDPNVVASYVKIVTEGIDSPKASTILANCTGDLKELDAGPQERKRDKPKPGARKEH